MLAFHCKSQDRYPLEWNEKIIVDSLKNLGISQIATLEIDSPGARRIQFKDPELHCDYKEIYHEIFIIWEQNKITNIKKYNNCFEFETHQSQIINLFSYYRKNKLRMRLENLNLELRKIIWRSSLRTTNHSTNFDFTFYSGKKINELNFNLSEIKFNPKIYKKFNQTKTAGLLNILKEIDKLEFEIPKNK